MSVIRIKVRKMQTTAMLRNSFDGFDKAAELRLEYFKMCFLPVKPL
jgi:hypothetical protein